METKTVMSLTERASVARASRDANIREAIKLRQERQSIHHVLLKASMYATLRHEVEAEDGVVNEAVNKGHDSVSIFNYYVPVNNNKLNNFFISHSSHSLGILPNTENVFVKLDVLSTTFKHCLHVSEINR